MTRTLPPGPVFYGPVVQFGATAGGPTEPTAEDLAQGAQALMDHFPDVRMSEALGMLLEEDPAPVPPQPCDASAEDLAQAADLLVANGNATSFADALALLEGP
jgi:hypothetical protein